MRNILAIVALSALAACSSLTGTSVTATLPTNTPATIANGMTTAASVIATGQLVCKLGPAFAVAVDPSGAPLIAKAASSSYVQTACASVNGIAIAPPANGVPGTVTVTVPAAS